MCLFGDGPHWLSINIVTLFIDKTDLHGDFRELLSDPLVYLQVLGHTSVHQGDQ
jgi:hypothetical protein